MAALEAEQEPIGNVPSSCLPSTNKKRGPGCQEASAIIRSTKVWADVEVRTTTTTRTSRTQYLPTFSSERAMKRTVPRTFVDRLVPAPLKATTAPADVAQE